MTATDLYDLTPGIGQRFSTVEFDLLDQYNSYLGRLTVDTESTPRIENNINRAIKRTMSGLRLPPDVTADVDTLRMRVRPWWVLQDGSREPLGVFLFADATRAVSTYSTVDLATPGVGRITEGSMLDQGATLNQGSRGINFYGPGTLITDALAQQLDAGGVAEYVIEPSDATISDWVVWKPNTKRLTVINDLCRMGGYYSLFFDGLGVAQAIQVPALESAQPTFYYGLGRNVFADSVAESDDLLSAPNVYVVVNTAFTDAPVWGEWRVPAESPHSYANRGFFVVSEHDVQGVESRSAARKAAKAIGQADYATYRWLDIDTAPDPRHDTYDVIDWEGDRYREQAWSLPLVDGAKMHHELRRIWSETAADFLIETDDEDAF